MTPKNKPPLTAYAMCLEMYCFSNLFNNKYDTTNQQQQQQPITSDQ